MELTSPMEVTESPIVTWVRPVWRKACCSPGKGGVGVCVGLDAPSRQLDMEQGAAKAGTPLPRGELVGEARGGLARRWDICCCDPLNPPTQPNPQSTRTQRQTRAR